LAPPRQRLKMQDARVCVIDVSRETARDAAVDAVVSAWRAAPLTQSPVEPAVADLTAKTKMEKQHKRAVVVLRYVSEPHSYSFTTSSALCAAYLTCRRACTHAALLLRPSCALLHMHVRRAVDGRGCHDQTAWLAQTEFALCVRALLHQPWDCIVRSLCDGHRRASNSCNDHVTSDGWSLARVLIKISLLIASLSFLASVFLLPPEKRIAFHNALAGPRCHLGVTRWGIRLCWWQHHVGSQHNSSASVSISKVLLCASGESKRNAYTASSTAIISVHKA
jgi:hypothetical protein